jgi:tyrosinase
MAISRRAVLSYATLLGFPQVLIDMAASLAQAGPVRVRQNIDQFAQDSQKVAALRGGVGKMKARSQTNRDDPLGWYYWSAVHGTTDAIPNAMKGIYQQCAHTDIDPNTLQITFLAEHFMSWHRPFLFFFETTLKRAAQEAGFNTSFELPYWNWYTAGDLPQIFVEGDENSNPLLHPRTGNSVNSAGLSRAPFGQKDLLPSSTPAWRQSFSVPFEFNPHGAVHNLIGKDMGNILKSARDPIFWLHHANIDRLWTVWTKMAGHKNPPTDSTWAHQVFTYDKGGQMTQTAGAVVNSETSLNYRYDDESPLAPAPLVAMAAGQFKLVEGTPHANGGSPAAVAPQAVPGQQAAAKTVSSTTSLSLGSRSVAVDLKLPSPAQTQLHALAVTQPTEITGAWLVLENVEIGPDGQDGGFSFSVKATLPDGSGGTREVELAELGTFTWPARTGAQGHEHGYKPITLTIPLKGVLGDLGVAKPADLAKGLRVVFQAAHREKAGGPDPQFVKIGAISIKTSTAPLQ